MGNGSYDGRPYRWVASGTRELGTSEPGKHSVQGGKYIIKMRVSILDAVLLAVPRQTLISEIQNPLNRSPVLLR